MNINNLNMHELCTLDTLLLSARQAAFKGKETFKAMANADPCEDNMLAYRQADAYYRSVQSLSTKLESTFNLIVVRG